MEDTLHTLTIMQLILKGTITIWENEGPKITAILKREGSRSLLDAMDAIGTTLYWVANELEDTLIPDAQRMSASFLQTPPTREIAPQLRYSCPSK